MTTDYTTLWGRELDKEVERRRHAELLTFDDHGHEEEILIYRQGIDDVDGVPYDALARYHRDMNAAWTLFCELPVIYQATIWIKITSIPASEAAETIARIWLVWKDTDNS